jgi:hypothetical protein
VAYLVFLEVVEALLDQACWALVRLVGRASPEVALVYSSEVVLVCFLASAWKGPLTALRVGSLVYRQVALLAAQALEVPVLRSASTA